MELRRTVGFIEIEHLKRWTFGKTVLRVMNSKNDNLKNDPNAQSIVIKIQHVNAQGNNLSSALLTGDTDAQTWRYSICQNYDKSDLSTDILLASHHGSLSFFDDPSDEKSYYLDHLNAIAPAMTIISVGDNAHGHPEDKAVKFYESKSSGSDKGNKLKRTDVHDNIKLVLKDEGGWSLWDNQ
jgi:beta-lactamase superfamily II metal-dependent hydrolase